MTTAKRLRKRVEVEPRLYVEGLERKGLSVVSILDRTADDPIHLDQQRIRES